MIWKKVVRIYQREPSAKYSWIRHCTRSPGYRSVIACTKHLLHFDTINSYK
ncbi:hypothetical protein Hanom_Chr16g01416591 [Helianthus anomalus]